MPAGRPVSRLHRVPEQPLLRMRGVFGTAVNAHRELGLKELVAFQTFYRAWKGLPVSDRVISVIVYSWDRFRRELAVDISPESGTLGV